MSSPKKGPGGSPVAKPKQAEDPPTNTPAILGQQEIEVDDVRYNLASTNSKSANKTPTR
jgi:hypothetical protein